ncbi:hypothetical protein D3C73_892880 [compost metagenome]
MFAVLIVAAGVAVFLQVIFGLQRQIFPVVVRMRGVIQREGAAGGNAQCGSGAFNLLMLGLPGFLTDTGVEFPLLMLGIAARPVVNVNLTRRRGGGVLTRLKQPGVGFAEVVIVEAVNTRRDVIGQGPLADAFFAGTAARRRQMVRDHLIAGIGLMMVGRIAQHQGVLAHLVFEIVIDTLQLHQPADEVEAALVVLHAIAPQAVVARELVFQLNIMFGQQGFDDLRHRLFLEDAEVAVLGHRPQIRLHVQVVHRITGAADLFAADGDRRDLAVQVAGRAKKTLGRDLQRQGLAQQRFAVEAGVFAQQFDGEIEG